MTWWGESRLSRQQKVMRLLRSLADSPVTVIRALPGEIRQRLGHEQNLEVDEAWDEHLHGLLGAPWPCPQEKQIDEIMADIGALLAARGLRSGRFTYGWYSDAEILLCRAVWCVALHTRPEVVIETGVAHGVTSRVALEALKQNDFGHLWSIDLPFPFDHRLHGETGAVVTDACRPRWSYLEGSSSQRLPPLVAEVGHVEMFVHDSLHTAKNTLFEMEQAASVMPSGGVMLVDDIGGHDGFTTFARRHPHYQTLICPSADQVGIFGIAVNTGAPEAAPAQPGGPHADRAAGPPAAWTGGRTQIVAADLVRLEGNERSHLVAKRGRVHLGPHPAITPRSVIRCGQRADSNGVSWPGS